MARICKLLIALVCCFSLMGCSKQQKSLHLVTKISITDDKGIIKSFTEPQKMETILYYLRGLDPAGKPGTDPERIIGDAYRIDIEYADGGQSIYRQRANRFLSKDSHPWQTIDPKKAAILRPLLESIS